MVAPANILEFSNIQDAFAMVFRETPNIADQSVIACIDLPPTTESPDPCRLARPEAVKYGLAILMFALSLSGCERAPPPRLLGYEELGELRVATRSDALSHRIGTDGRESGFEHDLLLELGRYLGVPVKFSVLPSSLDSIYAVTHNNMHLAAAGLVRNERRQVIWSAPIRESSMSWWAATCRDSSPPRRSLRIDGSAFGAARCQPRHSTRSGIASPA